VQQENINATVNVLIYRKMKRIAEPAVPFVTGHKFAGMENASSIIQVLLAGQVPIIDWDIMQVMLFGTSIHHGITFFAHALAHHLSHHVSLPHHISCNRIN
jgi:hypothetical protein